MTRQEAIDLMKKRGYEMTSEAGNGSWIGFSKDMNGIWLSSQVHLEKQTVSFTGGVLKLGCQVICSSVDVFHKRFEEFERAMYFYGKVCEYVQDITDFSEQVVRRYVEVAKDEHPEIQEPAPTPPPKEPKKDVKTRKREFWDVVVKIGKDRNYHKENCKAFYDYWTQMNEGGLKMQFEIIKSKKGVFDIGGRLATWMKNEKNWKDARKTIVEKKAEKQDKETKELKIINKEEEF